MASLRELRKHLYSVEMTGQMAGAMKTAAAVKFSRICAVMETFSVYAAAASRLRDRFGDELGTVYTAADPDAPPCYVILGANRGLCGGYNIELYEYADRILAEAGDCRLIVTGRHATAHFRDRGTEPDAVFTLPDSPAPSDAEPVLDAALTLFREGGASSVILIWQRFVNTLNQVPSSFVLLPAVPDPENRGAGKTDPGKLPPLYLPDRTTVLRAAAEACVRTEFISRVLEAGAGHQAATLTTMRSACDNAEETAAALMADISHKRQSEVTSSVIETSGGNARREE